jgi:integrase
VLYPFVVLAMNTGMRYSDIRLLQWEQIDLVGRVVTVGVSKTGTSAPKPSRMRLQCSTVRRGLRNRLYQRLSRPRRASTRTQRSTDKGVERGPERIGSSGWTRTSNPPVNSVTLVRYRVASSWV